MCINFLRHHGEQKFKWFFEKWFVRILNCRKTFIVGASVYQRLPTQSIYLRYYWLLLIRNTGI